MNYERYNYFLDEKYTKLRLEKKEFELTSEKRKYSFLGPDGKIIEKKTLTRKEYEELSENEKYKLNKWSLYRSYASDYSEKSKEMDAEIGKYSFDFKKDVPKRFISDFAEENEIKTIVSENILRYTLTNINYTADIIMDTESEDFSDYWIKDVTFERFMNGDLSLYEGELKRINNMMKNNLDFLRLTKEI